MLLFCQCTSRHICLLRKRKRPFGTRPIRNVCWPRRGSTASKTRGRADKSRGCGTVSMGIGWRAPRVPHACEPSGTLMCRGIVFLATALVLSGPSGPGKDRHIGSADAKLSYSSGARSRGQLESRGIGIARLDVQSSCHEPQESCVLMVSGRYMMAACVGAGIRSCNFQARRHSDKEEGMGVRGIRRTKVDAGNRAVGLRYHLCG